jgi:hypothetical protein
VGEDFGVGVPSAYPAMRELLRQCVEETVSDVAFVALLDIADEGKRPTIAIPSIYPPSENSGRLITRWARTSVCDAIEAGRTQVLVGRFAHSGERHQQTVLLVVAPMYTTNGMPWGAVATLRAVSAIEWNNVNRVEQCAQSVTNVLTHYDDLSDHAEPSLPLPSNSRLTPLLERPGMPHGSRHDFLLHELRVPLSAARYALEALKLRHGSNWDESDMHSLTTAQLGVSEAQQVVNTASHWPSLGSSTVAPNAEITSVYEVVERTIGLLPAARGKVVQELEKQLPPILGNQNTITQVLVNLLENALKYSSPRREIEVVAHRIDSNFVFLAVRSWSDGPMYNRDFLSGSQTHHTPSDDPTSKGLGLNIARYFITSMGGEIWIDGDGTDGISVSMALPVAPSWAADTSERA